MNLCSRDYDQTITYIGTWTYFKALLVEVAQPCDQMLLHCSFGARKEICSTIFNSILTDDGLCCTFNALDPIYLFRNYTDDVRIEPATENSIFKAINWTPESGYAKNLPEFYYPRTSGGTGSRMGLTVVLNASTEEYYCTKSMGNGFKVCDSPLRIFLSLSLSLAISLVLSLSSSLSQSFLVAFSTSLSLSL